MDKALDCARGMGCRRVFIAGALGRGLDHALINVAILERRSGFSDIFLLANGAARLVGPGRYALRLRPGARFSLLAAPRAVVTLTGARYPLKGAALTRGSRGLGNAAASRVTLRVAAGRVWIAAAKIEELQ